MGSGQRLSCVAVWRGLAWFGSEKPGVNLSDGARPGLVRELSSLHRVGLAIELPTCDCSCDVAGCRTMAMRQLFDIFPSSVHLVVFLVNCDFRASLRIVGHSGTEIIGLLPVHRSSVLIRLRVGRQGEPDGEPERWSSRLCR